MDVPCDIIDPLFRRRLRRADARTSGCAADHIAAAIRKAQPQLFADGRVCKAVCIDDVVSHVGIRPNDPLLPTGNNAVDNGFIRSGNDSYRSALGAHGSNNACQEAGFRSIQPKFLDIFIIRNI